MKVVIILLVGFYSFVAIAADNKPTPAIECSTAAKGCTSNSINAKCSIMACKAKGCNGDYSSGDCKTLKDTHKAASCGLAPKKCGEKLPKALYFGAQQYRIDTQNMKIAPTKSAGNKFEIRKKHLLINKRVNDWKRGTPGPTIVELTVRECLWLGGTVSYWAGCDGTLAKCTAFNGREMCIDQIQAK